MKRSLLIFLGIVLAIALVTAAYYPEPFGNNLDINNYNLTDANVISAKVIEGTDLYVGSIFGLQTWCYQEDANVSTACGGKATGKYVNGSYFLNVSYFYDGNWSNYTEYSTTNGTLSYISMNYSKPDGALNSSIWKVKGSTNANNYSLDVTCWGQNSSTIGLRGIVQNSTTNISYTYWQCYNGTQYINTTSRVEGFRLYEEAMWWKLSNEAVINGSLDWVKLNSYPTACPSGAITALNDSVTCTDAWVDVAGDYMQGNLSINGTSFLKLESNTTSQLCNELNAGAIHYNNVTNKHYGCNVSGWQVMY